MAGRSTSAVGQNYKPKCSAHISGRLFVQTGFKFFIAWNVLKVCFENTSCLRVLSFLDSFSIVRDSI